MFGHSESICCFATVLSYLRSIHSDSFLLCRLLSVLVVDFFIHIKSDGGIRRTNDPGVSGIVGGFLSACSSVAAGVVSAWLSCLMASELSS